MGYYGHSGIGERNLGHRYTLPLLLLLLVRLLFVLRHKFEFVAMTMVSSCSSQCKSSASPFQWQPNEFMVPRDLVSSSVQLEMTLRSKTTPCPRVQRSIGTNTDHLPVALLTSSAKDFVVERLEYSGLNPEKHTTAQVNLEPYSGAEGYVLNLKLEAPWIHDGSNPGFCVSTIQETRNRIRRSTRSMQAKKIRALHMNHVTSKQMLILQYLSSLGQWPANPSCGSSEVHPMNGLRAQQTLARDINWTRISRQRLRFLDNVDQYIFFTVVYCGAVMSSVLNENFNRNGRTRRFIRKVSKVTTVLTNLKALRHALHGIYDSGVIILLSTESWTRVSNQL